MDDTQIDYTQHPDWELAEMFGHMDPRYAPEECARLGKYLAVRGYIVTPGEIGPGSAILKGTSPNEGVDDASTFESADNKFFKSGNPAPSAKTFDDLTATASS